MYVPPILTVAKVQSPVRYSGHRNINGPSLMVRNSFNHKSDIQDIETVERLSFVVVMVQTPVRYSGHRNLLRMRRIRFLLPVQSRVRYSGHRNPTSSLRRALSAAFNHESDIQDIETGMPFIKIAPMRAFNHESDIQDIETHLSATQHRRFDWFIHKSDIQDIET